MVQQQDHLRQDEEFRRIRRIGDRLEDIRDVAIGWLDEGMTPLQVAHFTGASAEQVRAWDRERSFKRNPAIELMHKGCTCAEIAEALGITERAAHNLVVDTWREDKERR